MTRRAEGVSVHEKGCAIMDGNAPRPDGGEAAAAPPSPGASVPSLFAALAKGSGWIVGGTYAARLVGLVNTLVVAWYLVPEDFGLFAIGLTFMQLITGFTEVGLSLAVVRFRDATDDDMDTLFTISAMRGALLSLVMLAAAPLAVRIYGDARLGVVFVGLAVVPLLTALINPRFYEFERAGDFSREFVMMVAAKLASVAITIGIAAATRSYAAIIAGVVAAAFAQCALSYVLRPVRPRATLASWRKVFGFTGWITLVAIFAALNNKLDAMLFGRVIGTAAAGQLYVGEQLAELATRDVSVPLARAIFPSLSARQDDPGAVREGFLQGVQALAAVALPLAVGFALVAHLTVPLLFKPAWADAVPVIQIVGPVLGLQTVFAATQGYAMAVGRVWIVALREAAFFAVRLPVVVWALLAHGFVGGLYAVAGMGLVHCVLNALVYARLSGDAAWRPVLTAWRSLVATGAMAGAVWALGRAVGAAFHPAPTLVALIGAGGLAYVATHAALWLMAGRPDGVEASVAAVAARRPDPA